MKYVNAMLMKIEDDRVVVIDGEKYLVLEESVSRPVSPTKPRPNYKEASAKKRPAVKKKLKPRVHIDQVRPAVLEILKANQEMKTRELFDLLRKEYNLDPSNSSFRSMLSRMKDSGLIQMEGTTKGAKWSLKKEEVVYPPSQELSGFKALEEEQENTNF
jgi:predicted HTH transcriptional regulator